MTHAIAPARLEQAARQVRTEGYALIEGVIPPDALAALRAECARFVALKERSMDEAGVDVLDLSLRGRRYFIDSCLHSSPPLARWAFGSEMARIVGAVLGPDAYLFNDQYVVKAGVADTDTNTATGDTDFSWHQDSAYVGYEHAPYLTAWCALDDVTADNGTVSLLPFSRIGTDQLVPHVRDPRRNDLVADVGGRTGVPAVAPAGSVAVFSSYLLHSSGANRTPRDRRVYVLQYSAEPLLDPRRGRLARHAVPFLRSGRTVADLEDLRDEEPRAARP